MDTLGMNLLMDLFDTKKHALGFRNLNGKQRLVDIQVQKLEDGRHISIVDVDEPDDHIVFNVDLTQRQVIDLVIKLLET